MTISPEGKAKREAKANIPPPGCSEKRKRLYERLEWPADYFKAELHASSPLIDLVEEEL